MKKRWIILIVLVVLLAALALKIYLVQWEDYRPQLESEISQALDAQVKLNGKLSISFFPYPKLEAENAELHARGVDIYTPSLRLAAKLWPLLGGKMILSSAEINAPEIRVVPEMWAPGRRKKTADETKPTNVQLEKAKIDDGTLVIDLNGKAEVLEDMEMELYAPDWHGPYHAQGDFVWQNKSFEFETLLGVTTPAGSRPLHFSMKEGDRAMDWQGAWIAVPFAMHGVMEGKSDIYETTSQNKRAKPQKAKDQCQAGTMDYLMRCFLFKNATL